MHAASPHSSHDRTLRVAERHDGEWLVLALEGDLDIASAPGFAIEVRDHVRHGATAVCVDLSHIGFVDTSGIAAMLNAERSVSRVDGRFVVLAPPGSEAQALLRRMGTRGLLSLAASADELSSWPV